MIINLFRKNSINRVAASTILQKNNGSNFNNSKPSDNNFIFVNQRRDFGFAVFQSKNDINLGPMNIEDEIMQFRNKSERTPDHNVKQYRSTYWRVDEYLRRAQNHIEKQGFFYLPTLDFPLYKGCSPLFSGAQLLLHYSRHHRAYVDKLNSLVNKTTNTNLYGLNLDVLIAQTFSTSDNKQYSAIFNNAAQHFNHCFFWKSIVPYGVNLPRDLRTAIRAQYGTINNFENKLKEAAMALFGSGWVYWVYDKNSECFDIISYSNAGCPLTNPLLAPLICVDVWEHSYYLDYENNRAEYLNKFLKVIDYHWAERNWKRATGQKYEEINYS